MTIRHVTSLSDLTTTEIERVFAISRDLKAKWRQGVRESLLGNRMAALLFEKPSLRTRVSFETGMAQLGGSSMFLGADVGWGGERESVADFARVLSQYVDVIVCRANQHRTVQDLADHAQCPVINGLTDVAHPCQALADLFTLGEVYGSLRGRTLAFVGDANNVARCLLMACAKLDVRFAIACPAGYDFDPTYLERVRQAAPQLQLVQTRDPIEAVQQADAVYTDVWTSMGQEAESEVRSQAFAAYQVDEALMNRAPTHARFLHCLPARRGEEVTDAVIDGPHSAVLQQAANRMHVQKGLLVWLLTETSAANRA